MGSALPTADQVTPTLHYSTLLYYTQKHGAFHSWVHTQDTRKHKTQDRAILYPSALFH